MPNGETLAKLQALAVARNVMGLASKQGLWLLTGQPVLFASEVAQTSIHLEPVRGRAAHHSFLGFPTVNLRCGACDSPEGQTTAEAVSFLKVGPHRRAVDETPARRRLCCTRTGHLVRDSPTVPGQRAHPVIIRPIVAVLTVKTVPPLVAIHPRDGSTLRAGLRGVARVDGPQVRVMQSRLIVEPLPERVGTTSIFTNAILVTTQPRKRLLSRGSSPLRSWIPEGGDYARLERRRHCVRRAVF